MNEDQPRDELGRFTFGDASEAIKSAASDNHETLQKLDSKKNELLSEVEKLKAKKKKLYSNMDIESPMSADEKDLDRQISGLFSEINSIVIKKRSLKK